MSNPLILVSTFDGTMADGRRVSWQSYRPAAAAASTKPTIYTSTLGAYPDALGVTTYNLRTAGVQASLHSVQLTLVAGAAELTFPGSAPVAMTVGKAVVIPARGEGDAVLLSFTGDSCSLQAAPDWPQPSPSGPVAEGDGDGSGEGDPPPPPLPGDED